jgi:hypothetical protein
VRLALLAAAVVVLLVPATASASTLSVSGGVAQYNAAPADANHLTMSFVQGYYVFYDSGVSSIAVSGSTCHAYSAQIAYCPSGAFTSITARLGNGGSYAHSYLTVTPVTMYAGNGGDTLIGGAEPDTLVTGAGRDKITCGDGVDHVQADPTYTVATDCEQVEGGAATATPDIGTGAPDTSGTSNDVAPVPPIATPLPIPAAAPVPHVLTAPVTVTSSNSLPLKVACPAGTPGGCQGTVTLALDTGAPAHKAVAARRRKIVLRSRRFKIPAGKTATVAVPLDRRTVKFLRARGRTRRFKATVTVATRTEAGTFTSTRTVQVRAARRRPTPKHSKGKTAPRRRRATA